MSHPPIPRLVLCELEDPGIPGLESYSPFCLKVHRALRVCGLPYERRPAPYPAAHGKLSSTGQVPILLIDDIPVGDSTAIFGWLLEHYPQKFAPGLDTTQVGEAWLWEEFADSALNGYLVAARWADERNWPLTSSAYFHNMPVPLRLFLPAVQRRKVVQALRARDVWRAGASACWDRFERVLDHLEARAPHRGFWLGTQVCLADVALFAQLHSLRTPLTRWQAEQITSRPHLTAWLDRVQEATLSQAR